MNFLYPMESLPEIKSRYIKSETVFRKGVHLVENEMCTFTSGNDSYYRFIVEDRFDDFKVNIRHEKSGLSYDCTCGTQLDCCAHVAAAMYTLYHKYQEAEKPPASEGKPYTRKEMIKRVLKERQERAAKEEFKIEFGENIHGVHRIKTQSVRVYEITIRDFKEHNGYCSCPDFKTNKLGTCKHLIYASEQIKKKYNIDKTTKIQPYPFIEIFCDPHFDYHITHYHQRELPPDIAALIKRYFKKPYIMPEDYRSFSDFIAEAEHHKAILIRPEVTEKLDKYFEKEMLKNLAKQVTPDFSKIKAKLFDYQKKGISFSLFKSGSIIADEMGLGKTVQATAVAVIKKDIYNLNRTLVICPASLKYQWKSEIERFSHEKAVIVEGFREDRRQIYRTSDAYFLIANYEAVLRDITTIIKHSPDMIILDEAQRIKNYDTKTSHAVKAIPKKHALVISGTPLENRLLDLYSIMNFIDPEVLSPQWEFSMNHCYFDKEKKNKITGYYNLQQLKEKLADYIIRREKSEVLKELPEVQEMIVPVELHHVQAEIHAGLYKSLAPILAKKYKTFFDMQRIQQILTSMRMVCDCSYLVDKETNYSPKLDELQEILLEKLDIVGKKKKVLIFSEWKTMLQIISKRLGHHGIHHVMLSGEVPVAKRGKLIEEFAQNPDSLVFLSTEAGGSGLNLQFADTVINFDLPWNPAKKNQRIGRVNRIGQQSSSITAINLVALNSIEARIADGIVLKQSLFDAVLSEGDRTDAVDFAAKGRSTFVDQIQKLIQPGETVWETDESDDEGESETILPETEEGEEILAPESQPVEKPADLAPEKPKASTPAPEEIETTLNHGMQFLSGVFKMATGKELRAENQTLSVDKETGEVVMKFKLPGY
ncbi:DEAD/DEAH box helicase [candidate division KSB1 bacterium]|nr:DEAD/DEAH box helicase [candidate division KSB1 bacterium]NIR73302.1 DEAD/DEAH box helicase [candidate division KSB1 bacterium]NIS27008.1 DEAD/DEAH box helicase [candidate division KSB1 bacterium]NIT73848.1 DEAD/DEAH box helicase [candidate division KSB1 bacterium]NIU27753.1 DEAD/DEAH box helicase [candidate division KSB1 bacterium]